MKRSKKSIKTKRIETHTEVSVLAPLTQEVPELAAANRRASAAARQVEMVSLSSLKKSARNARTHSKRQIEQIASSILRFGFTNPVIVDSHSRIIAGHGRAKAAELIGFKIIPILRVTDLSDTELRALTLADNRIAESAGWDRELLAVELKELQIALPGDRTRPWHYRIRGSSSRHHHQRFR